MHATIVSSNLIMPVYQVCYTTLKLKLNYPVFYGREKFYNKLLGLSQR